MRIKLSLQREPAHHGSSTHCSVRHVLNMSVLNYTCGKTFTVYHNFKKQAKNNKTCLCMEKNHTKIYRQIIPVGKGEIPGKFISIFSELFPMSIIILKIKTKE